MMLHAGGKKSERGLVSILGNYMKKCFLAYCQIPDTISNDFFSVSQYVPQLFAMLLQCESGSRCPIFHPLLKYFPQKSGSILTALGEVAIIC